MSKARNLGELLDANGDVLAGHLDHQSTSASDLTSGTLPAARLAAAATQASSDNSTKVATTAYVTGKITTLIGGAPSTLNDLNELAAAINDDASYHSTLTTALATKLPLAGGAMTGNIVMADDTSIGISDSAERIEFDGAGDINILGANLGIGTTAPTNLLHIDGAAGNTFKQFTNNTTGHASGDGVIIGLAQDDSMLRIENRENGHIRFNTNNTERMRITNAGKLGIGTSAPYTALHIKGSSSGQSSVNSAYNNFTIENDSTAGMSILTGTSSIGGIVFGDSGDNDIGKIEYAHSGNSMRFTVNASEAMRITDNGTIGIGNNIPNTFSVNANNLVVGSGSGSEGITIYSGNSSAGNIFFADSADNNEETRGGVSYQHNGNKMQFRVNDANRMEIMSDGKVGIGHTSPPSQLTIQGGVEYRTAPAPGSGTLDIRDTGAEGGAGPVGNHGGGIVLGVTAGKGFCGIKAGLGDGGGNTAGHMKFYTRGATGDTHMSERMRIEYNGRVQINSVAASPASGGNLIAESNSGNGAAMTLVGDSNVSAGFGNKVVALNFSAKNYLAYNNPGVWAQIRAENGNGSYSDRGQLVFSTGYGGSTINDHMNLYSEGHLTLGHASNAPASQGSSSELTFYNNGNFYTISNNSRISASSERQTFRSAGTQVGAISAGGSSTSYGTSSDYRLKENVNYSWDATTILKQLKPARFNWISDDTNTLVDGFIAHEAAAVVPDSVFGVKDAMAPETYYVDGDELPAGKVIGDVKTYSSSEIKPQQLDQSKLVPLLVKTIQELEARLTAGGL